MLGAAPVPEIGDLDVGSSDLDLVEILERDLGQDLEGRRQAPREKIPPRRIPFTKESC